MEKYMSKFYDRIAKEVMMTTSTYLQKRLYECGYDDKEVADLADKQRITSKQPRETADIFMAGYLRKKEWRKFVLNTQIKEYSIIAHNPSHVFDTQKFMGFIRRVIHKNNPNLVIKDMRADHRISFVVTGQRDQFKNKTSVNVQLTRRSLNITIPTGNRYSSEIPLLVDKILESIRELLLLMTCCTITRSPTNTSFSSYMFDINYTSKKPHKTAPTEVKEVPAMNVSKPSYSVIDNATAIGMLILNHDVCLEMSLDNGITWGVCTNVNDIVLNKDNIIVKERKIDLIDATIKIPKPLYKSDFSSNDEKVYIISFGLENGYTPISVKYLASNTPAWQTKQEIEIVVKAIQGLKNV